MFSNTGRILNGCKNTRVPLTFSLVIVILLGSLGQSWADTFNSGWQAGERGDWETAIKLYTQAADEGDFRAQTNLGNMYHDGEHGLPEDRKKAGEFYKLAADQGDTSAMYMLGLYYYFGGWTKVKKDLVKAYVYLDKAGYDGTAGTFPLKLPVKAHSKAHEWLDEVGGKMSTAQLEEAKALLLGEDTTPDLISAYESYLWVKACYVVRKEYEVQFIVASEMAAAKKQVRTVQDAITSQNPAIDPDKIWDSTVESTGDVKWIVEQGVNNSWSTTKEQCHLHKTVLMSMASHWESQGETKKDF
jgi:hypothetical protein